MRVLSPDVFELEIAPFTKECWFVGAREVNEENGVFEVRSGRHDVEVVVVLEELIPAQTQGAAFIQFPRKIVTLALNSTSHLHLGCGT